MDSRLPSDPVLPQLPQALDGSAMAPVFASLLQGPTLLACDVDRVKYRPQRDCSVTYRLCIAGRSSQTIEQLVAARFCSGGDSLRRYRQALARGALRSAAGPSVSHLTGLDMVACWLPNDAKLTAPALLADHGAMRRDVLPDVVAALTAGHGRLVDHRTRLVQIVPELRVCARVDLHLRARRDAPVSTATVYAKADLERSGTATQAAMQALYDSPARAQGRLCMAQPLRWQADTGLHWQAAVAGRALQDSGAEVAPHIAARVGGQLAALHATPVHGLEALSVATLAQQVQDSAALLARVEPAWRPQLQAVAAWLQGGLPALVGQPEATLHGDLHLNNILVDGSRLAFIDFDSVTAGPAVIELGGWVADVLHRSVLQGADTRCAAPACRAFFAAYTQAAGQPPLLGPLLAWSTVHALLCKRAYRGVANLKPGRFAAVPALLTLAEAIARRGTLEGVLAPMPEAA